MIPADGGVRFLQQGARQLLAVFIGAGWGVPGGGEVVAKGENGSTFVAGQDCEADCFMMGEFGFGLGGLVVGLFDLAPVLG